YDKNDPPSPTKIVRPDGAEWRHEGSSWYEYKDGKPTGETIRGDIEVESDGEIVTKNAAGKRLEKWRPDGKIEKYPNDQPRETTDGSERIYPGRDGAKDTKYTFKDGTLVEAATANEEIWKRTDNGKWQQYKNGEPFRDPLDVEFKVSRNGDCVVTKKVEVNG